MLLYTRSNLYKILGFSAFAGVLLLVFLNYRGFFKGSNLSIDGIAEKLFTFAGRNQIKNTQDAPKKASVFSTMLKPLIFKPVSISIPEIGLKDVSVVEVGVEASGRLEVPKSFDAVAWYKNGPRAGEDGNAILAGHYDRIGGGPAIFFNLVKLSVGDEIEVMDEVGRVSKFRVYEVTYVDINDDKAVIKAYGATKEPILTLITCGGVWDYKSKDYSKRLLIKARKV